MQYAGLKIRASDVRQIAAFCKALQNSHLAFRLSALSCADKRGRDPDPALDPAHTCATAR